MARVIEPEKYDVTPSLFLEWRSPRFGDQNPTKLKSKVWEWLVHSKLSAYEAKQTFPELSLANEGLTWSFQRFGQSVTKLSDGRVIYIAGEHEDYYDPDFYIYNDVVVINPDQSVDFYCYPRADFPPTDFHSATLVDNKIIIVGNLGYVKQRQKDYTPIYVLNLENFRIEKIESSGLLPGWIHEHEATLDLENNSIVITKGKIDLGDEHSLRENIDDWKLNLIDWSWERLTQRNWTRWEIRRSDKKYLHLWDIRQALWSLEVNWKEDYKKLLQSLKEFLGYIPDVTLVKDIYNFDFPHESLQKDEEEHNVFLIYVDGVKVRFIEDWSCIQVTVEGILPSNKINLLKQQLLNKFAQLQNTDCVLEEY